MTSANTSRIAAFPSLRAVTADLPATASAAASSIKHNFDEWKNWENSRESFPGEHWVVLGAGVAALVTAARSERTATRVLGAALGLALLARAASGRDGIVKALPYLPEVPSKRWF